MTPAEEPMASPPDGPVRPLRAGFLERRWRSAAVVGGAVVGIAALVVAAVDLTGRSEAASWGSRNQPILMAVLVLANFLLIAVADHQGRRALEERRRRQHRRLLGILTVSRTMGAETNPQHILDGITAICRKTYACDQVSLMRLDREANVLEMSSASGHRNLEEVLRSRVPLGEGIAGWVAENRVPLILGPNLDGTRFNGAQTAGRGIASAMVVPILLRDELFGVLSVSSRSPRIRYDDEDLETLLVFAETAGIATRHAEQSTWMRQTIQRLDGELLRKDQRSAA